MSSPEKTYPSLVGLWTVLKWRDSFKFDKLRNFLSGFIRLDQITKRNCCGSWDINWKFWSSWWRYRSRYCEALVFWDFDYYSAMILGVFIFGYLFLRSFSCIFFNFWFKPRGWGFVVFIYLKFDNNFIVLH